MTIKRGWIRVLFADHHASPHRPTDTSDTTQRNVRLNRGQGSTPFPRFSTRTVRPILCIFSGGIDYLRPVCPITGSCNDRVSLRSCTGLTVTLTSRQWFLTMHLLTQQFYGDRSNYQHNRNCRSPGGMVDLWSPDFRFSLRIQYF